MVAVLKKINILLDRKQKSTMAGLLVLMIMGAFLQTAGVGLLVQVVNVVIDRNAVEHSRIAALCYGLFGGGSYERFAVTVMVMLIVTFIVKNVFLFVQLKLTYSFV